MALARILVVEDDEKLNHIVCAYLSGVGYQATGCLNGEEALKKLEEAKYDMIVTDIMMPKTDGFRLAEEVRASDKQIPILFMTARDDMTAKQRGYRIGIDDYVVKPFDPDELDILFKLLSYPKKTFTRSQLMELFWDYDSSATSRTVDVYMAKLREKTAACDGFDIVTVHGLGYKAVLR